MDERAPGAGACVGSGRRRLQWDQILAINLSSAFYSIKAALPSMRRRRWGRIVNIASAHGLVASATKSAYVAAKHGLLGLTKVVALETAQSPVTCNAICPGWVLTPLVQKQIDDAAARDGISRDESKARLLAEKQPSSSSRLQNRSAQSRSSCARAPPTRSAAHPLASMAVGRRSD